MYSVPSPYPSGSCSCGSPFLDNDIKISSVTKEVTQCMTAVTAIAGFNNYHELKDEDQRYLYKKISVIINSLNDLKDIFQVKENSGRGKNTEELERGETDVSILSRTINSLQRLKNVCGSIQLGGTVEKASLIEAIAHVSDNLVNLAKRYDISEQDLRDTDHGQEMTLKDIYPTATSPGDPLHCPKICNC